MNERDTTKLWYLADAIVGAPAVWQKLIRIAERDYPGIPVPKMSRPLALAVRALKNGLDPLVGCKYPTRDLLRKRADKLLKGNSACKKDAGRALSWALDLRSKR